MNSAVIDWKITLHCLLHAQLACGDPQRPQPSAQRRPHPFCSESGLHRPIFRPSFCPSFATLCLSSVSAQLRKLCCQLFGNRCLLHCPPAPSPDLEHPDAKSDPENLSCPTTVTHPPRSYVVDPYSQESQHQHADSELLEGETVARESCGRIVVQEYVVDSFLLISKQPVPFPLQPEGQYDASKVFSRRRPYLVVQKSDYLWPEMPFPNCDAGPNCKCQTGTNPTLH